MPKWAPGFCLRTPTHNPHHGRGGDCLGGALGAFSLNASESHSWRDAGRACRALCNGCPRCFTVSFSLVERECGWFRHCDLDHLETLTEVEQRHARIRARARGRPTNESLWRTVQIKQLPFPDERARDPITGVKLRTFSVVRWPQGLLEIPFWVVDDWTYFWIVGENNGEALVMTAIRRAASECHGGKKLMLDIGANVGTYGILSAALGCRVIAFEPQSNCRTRMNAALQRNGFLNRVRIVPQPVGRNVGATLWTPARGCHSTAPSLSSAHVNVDRLTAVTTTSVQRELQDDETSARIAIVKIDTEGAEVSVLESLRSLWPRIENIIVETNPFRWPKVSNSTVDEAANLYAELFEAPANFLGAYTSGDTHIESAEAMRAYILGMGRGYWDQQDIWFYA